MQKKLIALAVGATIVAAPMMAAQADVKIKGRVEVELANTDGGKYDSVWRQGDYNGMSRMVFDASKDLGNGLKAIGRYAFQYNPSDGAAERARDQYVGLSGGWGSIVAGRLPSPYKMTAGVKWDPYVATFMQARQQGGMSGTAIGHNSFLNDIIAYVMPELAGINATFAYHPSDDCNNNIGPLCAKAGTWAAGGSGKWGPIEVALKYLSTKAEVAETGASSDDINQASAGIRYTGNGLTAAYQYEDVDFSGPVNANGLSTGFTAGAGKFNFINLGYKFGNTLISGNWGNFSADNDGQDVDYWALGAKYYFDKKVSTYLGYASSKVTDDDTYDTFGIGMRYDF